MIPVLDSRRMRRADAAAIRGGIASADLMENAAAALVGDLCGAWPDWKAAVVVCGPGNNGGDGLAAARLLSERGVAVRIFTLRDPAKFRGDARENLERARGAGLPIVALTSRAGERRFSSALREADGVVDALFGTGLSRPLRDAAARAVAAMNASERTVVAADVPSGLSADTGTPIGPCVTASRTVAFGAPKVCHVTYPARALCGTVVVAEIGISRGILDRLGSGLDLTELEDVRRLLPPRPADSHKGSFGRVAVVAGSRGKAGAAILAARGALRAGAGLVTVFCARSLEEPIVAALPEAMTFGLPEKDGAIAEDGAAPALAALKAFDAAVVGPGLSTAPGTVAFLRRLLGARLPLICDADALNAFPGQPGVFSSRILTPHPGEAARLLGLTTRQVQSDRISAVRRLSRRSRAVVLLKGAASLVADVGGRCVRVNPTGTPLMSTAGSGDVLAGAIAAFVAGGMRPLDAVVAGAWLHGAAGEIRARRLGDAGLLAHELADALPRARRELARSPGGV